MTPFRHRRFIRKKEPLKLSFPVNPNDLKARRGAAGTPVSGCFVPTPVDNISAPVDNFLAPEVVSTLYYPYDGGMRGKEENQMGSKSHRVAMAQALLAELAESHARHGDTDGTRRLQAMVARMVAELLYR